MPRSWCLLAYCPCFLPLSVVAVESTAEKACTDSTGKSVCSGRGRCIDNRCQCEGARVGEFCEFPRPTLDRACPKLVPRERVPTRADEVRLDEVEIVMAMGDSMSLGASVVKPHGLEHRGWAFPSGGAKGAITLANFLKAYNPNLVGMSQGSLIPIQLIPDPYKWRHGNACPPAEESYCGLNGAVDGARVGWLKEQSKWIEDRMKDVVPPEWKDKWKDKWKLLTILIGLGDVVFGSNTSQTHPPPTDVKDLEAQFDEVFEDIYRRFPRTLVNLIALPENQHMTVPAPTKWCEKAHQFMEFSGIHWTNSSFWNGTIKAYNQMFPRLVRRWQKRACTPQSCSMAVALRTAVVHEHIGLEELDHFDCFHPNRRMAEALAINLWNEMVVGQPSSASHRWQTDETDGFSWTSAPVCLQPTDRFTQPNPMQSNPWNEEGRPLPLFSEEMNIHNGWWVSILAAVAGLPLVCIVVCCHQATSNDTYLKTAFHEDLTDRSPLPSPYESDAENDNDQHVVHEKLLADDVVQDTEVYGVAMPWRCDGLSSADCTRWTQSCASVDQRSSVNPSDSRVLARGNHLPAPIDMLRPRRQVSSPQLAVPGIPHAQCPYPPCYAAGTTLDRPENIVVPQQASLYQWTPGAVRFTSTVENGRSAQNFHHASSR